MAANPNSKSNKIRIRNTPKPLADYLLNTIDHLLKVKFEVSNGIANKRVRILDPVTGTKVFIEAATQKIYLDLEAQNRVLGQEIVDKEFNRIYNKHIRDHFQLLDLNKTIIDQFVDFTQGSPMKNHTLKIFLGTLTKSNYSYFLNYAENKLKSQLGMAAIIINNRFVNDTDFISYRRKILRFYDEVFVFNLEGSVFDPSQASREKKEGIVAIIMLKKFANLQGIASVKYDDAVNMEEVKNKIFHPQSFKQTNWQLLQPRDPYWFLKHKDTTAEEEFIRYWDLTDIMPIYNQNPMKKQAGHNLELMLQGAAGRYDISSAACFVNHDPKSPLKPFLAEWNYFFPLYNYFIDSKNSVTDLDFLERKPNFNPLFISEIRHKTALEFIINGQGNLIQTIGPKDIFCYVFAILQSNLYRERYQEQLQIYLPRIPVISNSQLIKNLIKKGRELVSLMIINKTDFNRTNSIFHYPDKWGVKVGGSQSKSLEDWQLTQINYQKNQKKVYVNQNQYFQGIEPAIWQYQFGSVNLLPEWLNYLRKTKKKLNVDDLKYFMKIIVSVKQIIKVKKEIDRLIKIFPVD
ncbi:MAG: hypothetical protein GF332_03805 [Candidatus Moranbacteria bacterium]|nr:hypothetical protein [Candidatus Moranbacteria bacterium]